MLPRSTGSKSASEALVALATEPVAMRSAKRAACPKGAARSMSSTCRGYLRARAAVVLMASVVVPAPPLAEKTATIGAAVRQAVCASAAAAADNHCPQRLSRHTATLHHSGPSPFLLAAPSRV